MNTKRRPTDWVLGVEHGYWILTCHFMWSLHRSNTFSAVESLVVSEPEWFLIRLLVFSVTATFRSLSPLVFYSCLVKTTDALGLFSPSVLHYPPLLSSLSFHSSTPLCPLQNSFYRCFLLFSSLYIQAFSFQSWLSVAPRQVHWCKLVLLYPSPSSSCLPSFSSDSWIPVVIFSHISSLPYLFFSITPLYSHPSLSHLSVNRGNLSPCYCNIVWVLVWRTPRSEGRDSSMRETEWEGAQ